ncbi:MAG TPA: glucose 1-dehydrogenase [Candidatus Polarisedimenticolaceae bacterium]|nr:glucose 1-dehydrogenase [Candidatus Polarisedimenticolaceae bacterium]
MMKAIAVFPGKPGSAHLETMPKPMVSDVPGGKGVLVRVLRVGVDGTDKEINAADYGAAPAGSNFLVIGHESFGVVEEVGENVRDLVPGDFVVAMVRRPGSSIYDLIGEQDNTTDDHYYERGINLRHGYLAEYYVDEARYIVKLPRVLEEVGVLLEPYTIFAKGIRMAFEAQRRLKVWRPQKAAVMGAGTVGMLGTLALRLRGFEVTTFARNPKPNRNAGLVESLGARYVNTTETRILDAAKMHGPFDLILEATGNSGVVFESMQALAKNGVLVLASVTGGDKRLEVPADKINLEFVLGNKLMLGTVNAAREDFEQGVRDMVQSEAAFPGFLEQFLTHPIDGLESYDKMFDALTNAKDAIKVYCVVGKHEMAAATAAMAGRA